MKEFLKKYWLIALLLIQPVLDIVAYFQYDNPIGTMAGYIRLVFLILIPLVVLITTKKKKSFIGLMAVIGIYCLLHVANGVMQGGGSIFQDISYLLKVIQMPVLAISMCYLFDNEKYKKQILFAFTANFLLITVSMIIAGLTGTGLYTYDIYKIGYLGWFANANAQSIIIITLVPFIIYAALKTGKILVSLIAMVCTGTMLILNGTKAGYLALFGILVSITAFFILKWIITRKPIVSKSFTMSMIVLPLILAFLAAAVYPLSPRYQMDSYSTGKREEENVSLQDKKQHLMDDKDKDTEEQLTLDEILADPEKKADLIECYQDELDEMLVEQFGVERVLEAYGWWPDSYILADVRLKKRINAQLTWEDCDTFTHLVGVDFTKMSNNDLENDYSALYYYYGYLGFGLYILFLLYFFVMIIRAMFKDFKEAFSGFNYMLAVVFCLQLGLAQFSGAILRRPNASIYMSIVLALIFYQCNKILKSPKKVK